MHTLQMYTVRVHDSQCAGPRDERYAPLDDIRGRDLIDEIERWARSISKNYQVVEDENVNKVFRFNNLCRTKYSLSGCLELGDFGVRSTIINVESSDTVHEKETDESDVLPLYFNVTIRPGEPTAIAIFKVTAIEVASLSFTII